MRQGRRVWGHARRFSFERTRLLTFTFEREYRAPGFTAHIPGLSTLPMR